MTGDGDRTTAAAIERREVGCDARGLAEALAAAAGAMATRIEQGATLRAVGGGVCAADAAHVVVEFMHPVIVGKRAIPSLTLEPTSDPVVDAVDVVLGLSCDGEAAVGGTIAAAGDRGCLTVELDASDGGASAADHAIRLPGIDVLVRREAVVSAYHLLWEIVHEYLDGRHDSRSESQADDAGLAGLYPFLYDDGADGDGADLDAHVVGSTTRKLEEVAALRRRVLEADGHRVVALGPEMGAARTVWTIGNGGSSTDAQALARLLRGRDVPGRPVDARALTDDVATVTALSNDVGSDVVFARMLRTLARPGDVLIALSTSGGSKNVLAGIEAAHDLGLTTVGFAGYDGGEMAGLDALDHRFVVPSSSVHRIQEAQTTLLHLLVEVSRDGR